jgi:hypothetical protein
MASNTKNSLLAAGSLVAIIASALWIYCLQFRASTHNVALHTRVGQVMAEQTAHAVGPKGRIVYLTIPTVGEPELATQLEAFRAALKRMGNYEIKEHQYDTKDQAKYGLGAGLSGRRYLRAVKNNPKADAIVSFVGAPALSDEEAADLNKAPKFIAEAKTPDHLAKLLEKGLIKAAVVCRFSFPAPGSGKPRTANDWFQNRYQILLGNSVGEIPSSGSE